MAEKEVKEEAGLDVRATKLLAVFDKACHPHPPSPYHVYKLFIQCEITGGVPKKEIETSAISFFAQGEMPPLSVVRNAQSQLDIAFKH